MRDGKLDFFKGLLIWSVVLGHTLNILCPGTVLHTVLRTFDLPMFMFISGWLMKGSIIRYDWKQFIVNKVTNIAFPAVIWIIISLLCGDLHSYYFLWSVFISSVIVCLSREIGKLTPNLSGLGGAILVMVAVMFYLIPKNIVNISYLFPCFIIGYFSKGISHIGWKIGVLSIIIFLYLILFVWHPDYTVWKTGSYILQNTSFMLYVVVLRLVIAMVGIYSVIFVMGFAYDMLKDSALIALFSKIGQQTLAIYLMQHIVVEIGLERCVGCMNINEVLTSNHLFVGYALTPIFSLILLIMMYYMVSLIQKCRYIKWVFGFRANIGDKTIKYVIN
ncbi:MAG: acyltransferase family protein [Prevotella sp.]|nr:acyltransferase family protein [Prevotella sp.]